MIVKSYDDPAHALLLVGQVFIVMKVHKLHCLQTRLIPRQEVPKDVNVAEGLLRLHIVIIGCNRSTRAQSLAKGIDDITTLPLISRCLSLKQLRDKAVLQEVLKDGKRVSLVIFHWLADMQVLSRVI